MTIIRTCVNKSVVRPDNYKPSILTFAWDGGFDQDIGLTNRNIYCIKNLTSQKWYELSSYNNTTFLPNTLAYYGHPYNFDCILYHRIE